MEPDLPEPKQRSYTPGEKLRRKWVIYVTFLYVVAAYSLLHKVFVPLVLKFTRLADTAYARIDVGALLPVVLLFYFRHRLLGTFGSLLAGVGIGYGIAEAYWIATNQYQGWLAISRFLSSTPLSLLCVILLSEKDTEKEAAWAWVGVLLMAAIFTMGLLSPSKKSTDIRVESNAGTPIAESDCRPLQIVISPKSPPDLTTLTIDTCGFNPKTSTLLSSKVAVENNLSEPVNVHLLFSKGEGSPRAGGNWMVPPSGRVEVQVPQLSAGEVAMWYSDTHPKLGIGALLPKNFSEVFELSRNPISLRRIR